MFTDDLLPLPTPAEVSTPSALWPIALIRDLALGIEDEDTILARYNISPEQYTRISSHPKFRSEYLYIVQSLQQSGEIFKQRARILAEDYLQTIDQLVNSPDVDAKTKLAAITKVVEWSGLGVVPKSPTDSGPTTAVQVNINL